jgi:tRNA(Ile)-lysidine synthase
LRNKVLKTIKENKLIKKGNKIILGISGGPDSVCLFNILYFLKKDLNLKIALVHVNYNFRGQDSISDEKFVRNLAKKHKVELYVKIINPKDYSVFGFSSCQSKNLEEYFREVRYDYFNEILKLEKANKIAVAHNKDDQIETILMHFMRGSGLAGLSGMKIKNNKIIRPLFEIEKKEILAYLKQNKIKYREDKTNKDLQFTRNKIRHQLIPYLEKKYNPNLKNTLYKNSLILRDEQELISNLVKNIFDKKVLKSENKYEISFKNFNSLHIALRRRLLIYVINEKFKKDISLLMVNEILNLLDNSKNGSKKIIKEIEIIKNYDKITIREAKEQTIVKKLNLKIIGETKIPFLGFKFITKKVDRCSRISKNKCYIDLNKVNEELFVRVREKGDKFCPKGIAGSQKLKDFFINQKIEQDKRDYIPLVVNDKNEIVWIVGFRVDKRFVPEKKSKNILEIQKVRY